ncbi:MULTISPECIES: uracil-xanthine permease family protein [Halorubrum]|uniref:Xanthine permease n=1 Tax=Halorubrum persicum TaxID=1383844 RepID=A0A2G1WMR6_9EURY|nr:solute carrier family 23 protein [Halorubrum persicum]OYR83021.1 xanthine permease [Halorubrum sp. E3]PHQ40266.1 xanthine permease [Halorubrum persicum]
MAGNEDESSFVQYGIDDKPPLGKSLLLGAQHYLTMVGANIAVPLILAGAMGMPDAVIPRFVGTFFVVSGIATLAQTTFGNRYPIVQGAPFSMLAPALAVIGVVTANPPEGIVAWRAALLQLQGAIIVAALAEVAIGYLGLVGRLRKHLSPVVIVPVIVLIGLSLFNAPEITTATQNWWLVALTLVTIVLFSQYLGGRSKIFQLFPVLLGIAVAWLLAAALSVSGVFAPGTPGYIDLASVAAADPIHPIYPLQWGVPRVTPAFVIGMLAGVAASIVESIGDYHAVARLSGMGAPSSERMTHGIGMEGLMNVFSGVMGTGGSTSYSENVGAIGLTGVASRYVVQIGAALMILVGFVGYFGQLVATIPSPIIGGLYIAMFAQIVGVGLSNLKYVDLDSSRNIFIIGIALFSGLAVPEYMRNVGTADALQQGLADSFLLGQLLGADVVANTLYVIGSTGMAVGGIVAFLLDNSIAGTAVERGLTAWEEAAEEDEEFTSAYDRFVSEDQPPRTD